MRRAGHNNCASLGGVEMSDRMRNRCRLSGACGVVAVVGMFVLGSGQASASPPVNNDYNTCNEITVNGTTQPPAPAGTDNVVVTSPNTATIIASLREQASPGNPGNCNTTAIGTDFIDPTIPTNGVQWNFDSVANVPVTCSATLNNPGFVFVPNTNFTDVDGSSPPNSLPNPYTVDNSGNVTRHFITSNFVNSTIGFRSWQPLSSSSQTTGTPPNQTTTNNRYPTSHSPCIDVQITGTVSNNPCNGVSQSSGAVMVLTGASGSGVVSSDSSGPWSYTFAICAFQDITLQSAQGGTSAWTSFKLATAVTYNASNSLLNGPLTCSTRKQTGSNNKLGGQNVVELCEWGTLTKNGKSYAGGTNIPNGGYALINVTVDGTVPNSAFGAMLNISGGWSALYYTGLNVITGTAIQTSHTTQAYVQVQ